MILVPYHVGVAIERYRTMIHPVNALLSSVEGLIVPIQRRRLVDLILRFGGVITRIAIAIELESKTQTKLT